MSYLGEENALPKTREVNDCLALQKQLIAQTGDA
jgi:hypothetical protein